jgi:hypothetical protein
MGWFRRFTLKSSEVPHQFDQPAYLVFTSERDFLETYGIRNYSPRVDFSRYFLVAVHRGACPTGGYRVNVEFLGCQQDQAIIGVRFVEPAPDDVVTLVVTYPQDMVLVPKQVCSGQGEVTFSFVDHSGNHLARRSVTMG